MRDIDPPRSKRCEADAISLGELLDARSNAVRTDGRAQVCVCAGDSLMIYCDIKSTVEASNGDIIHRNAVITGQFAD